jgi:hypothetical protein
MPSSKPRNAVYKDSVVAYLALKAHFAIADDHPREENMTELGKLMLCMFLVIFLRRLRHGKENIILLARCSKRTQEK